MRILYKPLRFPFNALRRLPEGLFNSSSVSTAFKISSLFKAFFVISEGIFLASRLLIPLNKSAVLLFPKEIINLLL